MPNWLKLIGTIDDPVDEYSESYVDYSARGYEYIVGGDRIILYATGRGMVFASANVVSEPRASDTQWPYRVDVEYRQGPFLVASGVHIGEIADDGHDTILQELQHQSFIPISESEFSRAEAQLQGIA